VLLSPKKSTLLPSPVFVNPHSGLNPLYISLA
jgi:hypothetical protein